MSSGRGHAELGRSSGCYRERGIWWHYFPRDFSTEFITVCVYVLLKLLMPSNVIVKIENANVLFRYLHALSNDIFSICI